ncbi:PEP-CTERM sorting domain-containing protein [Azohydromonas aeria]|uniref:PEP-CTERM sorting domain-containing protein n=1 Tax=Azohydromonas aeria TaxID=2590212 RepID=UPI0012FB0571|nr:PEP-CTERM sorting domain-containing protein [Azohydromonas aeria]
MKKRLAARLLSAAALATVLAAPSQAAFLTIDDSDPDRVTITAGDFDLDLFVYGVSLNAGPGRVGTVTLPDDVYEISGYWIAPSVDADRSDTMLFAYPSDPGAISSFAAYTLTGQLAGPDPTASYNAISLIAVADQGVLLGSPGLQPTWPSDGSAQGFTWNGLTFTFIGEPATVAAVPEPGSLALVALGLGALPLARRRRAHPG